MPFSQKNQEKAAVERVQGDGIASEEPLLRAGFFALTVSIWTGVTVCGNVYSEILSDNCEGADVSNIACTVQVCPADVERQMGLGSGL
jgi:hypothetical protein